MLRDASPDGELSDPATLADVERLRLDLSFLLNDHFNARILLHFGFILRLYGGLGVRRHHH